MKKLIFLILLSPIFITRGFAEELLPDAGAQAGIYALEEELSGPEREVSGSLSLDGSYDSAGALERLWAHFRERLLGALRGELQWALSLTGIALFCALAASLCPEGSIADYINIAGCCAAAYIISGSVSGIVRQALDALYRLSDYSRAALPAVFTAAAACGALSSAPVKYAAACMSMELFMSAAQIIIIPLISAYIALSLSASVFDNPLIRSASGLIKGAAVLLMSGICILFSSYIGISGIIAGSTDALAVKTARTVISNSLPVVGGIISDAASVVLASAALIKNSAGVFSLIAVCTMCAGPFALLSAKMILFRCAAAAADMLPGGRMAALLKSMGSAMTLLMALVGSCGIMLFISFMSAVRTVSS